MQTSTETIIDKPATGYTVRRLDRDGLGDLAELHAAVYGKPVDKEYYPRKYDSAYTGQEYVGYLAHDDEGKVVAYYGVIPCFVQLGDMTMLAAQSADTMTHPGFRFKGMFVDLSNRAFDLCRQLGIRLLFGFPNDNSYHGAVHKLGWKLTMRMECFKIDISTIPLESLARKNRVLEAIYRSYLKMIFPMSRLELFKNAVLEEGYAGIQRSEAYMQYRSYNPSGIIRIPGGTAWVRLKQGLMIGDLEGVTENNFKSVMNNLRRRCRLAGMRQMQFHVSPGTRLHDLLSSHYASIPSYHMLFQDFDSEIAPEAIRFTLADLDIF